MARDRASIRLDMWADQDWRNLSKGAQHLYMLLLSHPTLNYCGVAEWRPGRLAAMTMGETADTIKAAAVELQSHRFIVVDGDSEEVLIRSFIKHDGLMKQPKLVVSMSTAYAGVASRTIREVLAFEVQKLRNREPDLVAWSVRQVETILRAKGTDIASVTPLVTPPFTPGVTPTVTPNAAQAQGLRTTTATSTTTEASLLEQNGKLNETRLPSDWVPSKTHYELASSLRVDIATEADSFRLHAETHDRHAARWNAAFTQWLKKAKPSQVKRPVTDWMNYDRSAK